MLNTRITIAKRAAEAADGFGRNSQQKYEILCECWASETFSRGTKALREGALDAYDVVMFRLRHNADVDRWCLIQSNGKWYQILSLNDSYQDNQMQITAQEMTTPPAIVQK